MSAFEHCDLCHDLYLREQLAQVGRELLCPACLAPVNRDVLERILAPRDAQPQETVAA